MSASPSDATAPAALSVPSPASHPMDPRRGRGLSPRFSAFLCWLLDLPAMTDPAIVDAVVTGDCVFVATTEDPSFNRLLGSWHDCKANLRAWGDACAASAHTVDALIAKARHGAGGRRGRPGESGPDRRGACSSLRARRPVRHPST